MNIYIKIIICSAIGYLFGCIQSSYILGKYFKKIDIRDYGTKNAGASNMTINFGLRYGIATALIDILKGTAAVFIVKNYFHSIPREMQILLFITGAFVVLGHIFPFFMGFRGGKGTASLIGITLVIDFKFALIIAASLIIVTLVTNYIAIGSISMYGTLSALTVIYNCGIYPFLICTVLFTIAIFKHYSNIKRIMSHNEIGLREAFSRKK